MLEERYTSRAMQWSWSPSQRLADLLTAATLAARATDAEQRLGGDLALAVDAVRSSYSRLPSAGREAWLEEWRDREAIYAHDIAALVELIRVRIPGPVAQFFHVGRTSSDLVDIAGALAMDRAMELIRAAHGRMRLALCQVALAHADTVVMGRTHGQLAEPVTVGRRFAVIAYHAEPPAPIPSLAKLSGPVGTGPLHAELLSEVGLDTGPSTQVASRTRLVEQLAQLLPLTVTVSDVASLIRLGARSGGWCAEGRGPEARGSSSMPTKVNPVRSERVAGLATWTRFQTLAVTEAVSGLWEERDISHSSVERLTLPALTATAEFMLDEVAGILRGLEVRVPDETPVSPAGALTALVRAGMTYHAAYEQVRKVGPVRALDSLGLSVEVEPPAEPELWEWVKGQVSAVDSAHG